MVKNILIYCGILALLSTAILVSHFEDNNIEKQNSAEVSQNLNQEDIVEKSLDNYEEGSINNLKIKKMDIECKSCNKGSCQAKFIYSDDCCCPNEKLKDFITKLKAKKIDDYDFFTNIDVFKAFFNSLLINPQKIEVAKGKFDFKNPNKEIITATVDSYEDGHLVLIMNEDFNVNILAGQNYYEPFVFFENKTIKILNDYPEFFIGGDAASGGTCGSTYNSKKLYRIENLDLVLSGEISSTGIDSDKKPTGYNYELACSYRSESYVEYKFLDIDNDNEKEIIVSYFKQPFEGTDKVKAEFKEYIGDVILKWDDSKKQFILFKDKRVLSKATEVIKEDLPQSAEFWIEAYCPDSETLYDYEIPEGYIKENVVCEYGGIGSHGGCSTCIMSKIKLSRDIISSSQKRGKIDISVENLTGDIFYSDKKLTDYLVNCLGKYFDFPPTFSEKIYRGKFDVLNDNDVVLVSVIGEPGHVLVIEKKGKTYSIDDYPTSTYRIGDNVDITPTYLLTGEKPFFMGYFGGSTSGGCVAGEKSDIFYRIYEGKLKSVFSYKAARFTGDVLDERASIYENKNGLLTIIGYSESYQRSEEKKCENISCFRCEGDKLTKKNIFEVYKWNEDDQTFKLMSEEYVKETYDEFVLKNGNEGANWPI